MLYSLNKREKLSNKQDIQTLFSKGKAFFAAPLQLLILPIEQEVNSVKVGFAAPKKRYPTAVQRNRIKRLCREAYRLQKQELQQLLAQETGWHIMVIYSGKEILSLNEIKSALHKAFLKATHG